MQYGQSKANSVWPSELVGSIRQKSNGSRTRGGPGERIFEYSGIARGSNGDDEEDGDSSGSSVEEGAPINCDSGGLEQSFSQWDTNIGTDVRDLISFDGMGGEGTRGIHGCGLGSVAESPTGGGCRHISEISGEVQCDPATFAFASKGHFGDNVIIPESGGSLHDAGDGNSFAVWCRSASQTKQAHKQFVKNVVGKLCAYDGFHVGVKELHSLDSADLFWLTSEYYYLLASLHSARCTYVMAEADQIRNELISSVYKGNMLELFREINQVYADCTFDEFLHLSTFDDEIPRFIWNYFSNTHKHNKTLAHVFDVIDFADVNEGILRMFTWANRALFTFDVRYAAMVCGKFSRHQIAKNSDSLGDVEAMRDFLTQKFFKTAVLKKEAQFFVNYFGDGRHSIIHRLVAKTVSLQDQMLNERQGAEKGFCDTCGFRVLLQDHEVRCRKQNEELYEKDDWIGDALLALDVRLIILRFKIPISERGTVFKRSTDNKTIAKFVNELMGLKMGVGVASKYFEAFYHKKFRHLYLCKLIEEFKSAFGDGDLNGMTDTANDISIAIGLSHLL